MDPANDQPHRHALFHMQCACHNPTVRWACERITGDLSRRGFLAGVTTSIASAVMPDLASAQATQVPAAPVMPILFTNLRLFDGRGPALRSAVQVLVKANKIAAIADAGDNAAMADARVIDCGGRVVMPGLIDAHWHTIWAAITGVTAWTADVGYVHLVASAEAERTLMRGFTTVRDVGGPSFALKRAIDEGVISGPRIFPSGALISQTGGHSDSRFPYELLGSGTSVSRGEALGFEAIADGPDQVRRRTREQLKAGASQIKIAAGGGVTSYSDPLDSTQFRPEEIRAAVEAAADWGTYVTAHIYSSEGIRRCVNAGLKCIEHGQLADEDAVRLMVDKDVWWSLQPFTADLVMISFPDPVRRAKLESVLAGTDTAYGLAIKHKAKVGWGTDILFNSAAAKRQGAMLAGMTRWYNAAEVLKMATADNAALLSLSGQRSPYRGKLGVIDKDALADILVIDGDPTADLGVIADPERNLRVIMKDGRIYKNTL